MGLHNSTFALHNYIMKYQVVLEFYSNAKIVDETTSDDSLIKYLSRLAHLYLTRNEFNSFMESWQDILHIRMKKCQKSPCNRLNLGLKAFGNKKYALTIKYLQPYLKSNKVSLARKARIFVLVHHSHIMQGNLAKARQVLEDDFNITLTIHQIPLFCRNHQSCAAIQEIVHVDTFDSVVHSLLHTRILHSNYRTHMILAKFYIHWKKYDAGRELMRRVLFFLYTRNPQTKEHTIRRSTLIKILHDESLQKLLL